MPFDGQGLSGATHFAGRVWSVARWNELMGEGRRPLQKFDGEAALAILADTYRDRLTYVAGPVEEYLGMRAILIRLSGVVAWEDSNREVDQALKQWL